MFGVVLLCRYGVVLTIPLQTYALKDVQKRSSSAAIKCVDTPYRGGYPEIEDTSALGHANYPPSSVSTWSI